MDVKYLLVFWFVLSHAAGSSTEPKNELVDMAVKLIQHGGYDPEPKFEKTNEDVYCQDRPPKFDAPHFTGKVGHMTDCKAKCVNEPKCLYFAFWLKTKKCQTYSTCFKQGPDPGNRIYVMRRVTPCEQELPNYVKSIREEFQEGVVRPMIIPFEWEQNIVPNSDYPNPNFFCRCIGMSWMLCGIFVPEVAWEFQVMFERWTFADPEKMKPFFILSNGLNKYGGEKNFLAYAQTPPRALAELQVVQHVQMDGAGERPGCVHISQCIRGTPGGVEPLQRRPFVSGEPVYILEDDMVLVNTNIPMMCITVQAMRSYIMKEPTQGTDEGGEFHDPLGRSHRGREVLTIKEDYSIAFMFDELAMETGICREARDAAFTKKDAAETSQADDLTELLDEQLQIEGDSEAGPSSLGAKSKKKRKGGKGKKKAFSSAGGGSTQSFSSIGSSQGSDSSHSLLASPDIASSSGVDISQDPLVLSEGPSSGSPDLPAGPSSSSSSGKLKVTLSQADITKLKRSFQEAKSRRERDSEEHIAESDEGPNSSLVENMQSLLAQKKSELQAMKERLKLEREIFEKEMHLRESELDDIEKDMNRRHSRHVKNSKEMDSTSRGKDSIEEQVRESDDTEEDLIQQKKEVQDVRKQLEDDKDGFEDYLRARKVEIDELEEKLKDHSSHMQKIKKRFNQSMDEFQKKLDRETNEVKKISEPSEIPEEYIQEMEVAQEDESESELVKQDKEIRAERQRLERASHDFEKQMITRKAELDEFAEKLEAHLAELKRKKGDIHDDLDEMQEQLKPIYPSAAEDDMVALAQNSRRLELLNDSWQFIRDALFGIVFFGLSLQIFHYLCFHKNHETDVYIEFLDDIT